MSPTATSPTGSSVRHCPACGSGDLRDFHHQSGIPVNSCLLLEDPEEAAGFPTGDLVLAVCRSCGFIFNRCFDPARAEYSTRYEETQGFSPRFREFMVDLARRWLDRYDLSGRHLVEIGCGKGEFLATMCRLGGCTGTGIDPSWRSDRAEIDVPGGVTFIRDVYGEHHADLRGDAVICRHTLEHISPVAAFMELVRRSVEGTRAVLLWEVPDTERVLREVAFEDIYYEHCSYFTRGSLARLFRRTGFDPLVVELDYDDQYIVLEAVPGDGTSPVLDGERDLEETLRLVEDFEHRFAAKLDRWRHELEERVRLGKRTVLWGAGSKAVSYLTTLGVTDEVAGAVDINPYKQGRYLAGTTQRVIGPDELVTEPPDVVVVMNRIYLDEIRDMLAERGLHPELVAV